MTKYRLDLDTLVRELQNQDRTQTDTHDLTRALLATAERIEDIVGALLAVKSEIALLSRTVGSKKA